MSKNQAFGPGGWIYRTVRHPIFVGWLVFIIIFGQYRLIRSGVLWLFGVREDGSDVYPQGIWIPILCGILAGLVAGYRRRRLKVSG